MGQTMLRFLVNGNHAELEIDHLIVAGWVGKDPQALQKHIDELAAMGVAPPGRTPTYMNLSPEILSTGQQMTVVGAGSSGEVEAVVIRARDGQRYLGVGSDHTDREFEQYGIPASKQMCVKPLAATVWPFREVEDHLDQLVMRSWMTRDGKKSLYQEGTLGENRSLPDLIDGIPQGCVRAGESYCLFCGTFAAIGGLVYGERFDFEIYDPVLDRRLQQGYDITVLPQFL